MSGPRPPLLTLLPLSFPLVVMGYFVTVVHVTAAIGIGVAYKLGMLNQYLAPQYRTIKAEADATTAKATTDVETETTEPYTDTDQLAVTPLTPLLLALREAYNDSLPVPTLSPADSIEG